MSKKTVVVDNGMLSRGLHKLNLIAARTEGGEQVLFEFRGESVSGAVRVLKEEYDKNGKWSKTSWTVEVQEGVIIFPFSQDCGNGKWIPSKTWEESHKVFVGKMPYGTEVTLDPEATERFIRFKWPKVAERLDAEALEAAAPSAVREKVLGELIAAQHDLAAAQAAMESVRKDVQALSDAETARKEAAELRERAGKARTLLEQGGSLADLQAMIA